MKISFNRRKIESICILLSFSLIILLVFIGILSLADDLFSWNLLPHDIENIAYLFIGSISMIIGGSFVISIMVNLSIVSVSLEKLAQQKDQKDDKGNH